MRINRRKVLGALGTGSVGIASTGLSSAEQDSGLDDITQELIKGKKQKEYIESALTDLRTSSNAEKIRSGLERRNYELATQHSMVVRQLEKDKETIYVDIPLQKFGRSRHPNIYYNSKGKQNPPVASYVWSDSGGSYVLRESEPNELVAGLEFVPTDIVQTGGSALETITQSGHHIELVHFGQSEVVSAQKEVTSQTISIDVEQEQVDIETEKVTPDPEVGIESTDCPSTTGGVLNYLTACGGSCAACGVGNIAAILACIGCAGCGCFAGCCYGLRASSSTCNYIGYIDGPGGYLFGPGVREGARCAGYGCNGQYCA